MIILDKEEKVDDDIFLDEEKEVDDDADDEGDDENGLGTAEIKSIAVLLLHMPEVDGLSYSLFAVLHRADYRNITARLNVLGQLSSYDGFWAPIVTVGTLYSSEGAGFFVALDIGAQYLKGASLILIPARYRHFFQQSLSEQKSASERFPALWTASNSWFALCTDHVTIVTLIDRWLSWNVKADGAFKILLDILEDAARHLSHYAFLSHLL